MYREIEPLSCTPQPRELPIKKSPIQNGRKSCGIFSLTLSCPLLSVEEVLTQFPIPSLKLERAEETLSVMF